MGLKVTILSDELGGNDEDQDLQAVIELTARKTLSGDLIIQDHIDIDIVVSTAENKIITFPKKVLNDRVYSIQDKFFQYMARKGVINPASVQSGDLFSALEAKILESYSENIDPIQTAVFVIGKFIHKEAPGLMRTKHYRDLETDRLADPNDENSTRLGEVPGGDNGALNNRNQPYSWEYNYSVIRESK